MERTVDGGRDGGEEEGGEREMFGLASCRFCEVFTVECVCVYVCVYVCVCVCAYKV